MSRAASIYFSFFLRFQQSFQYYQANRDKSMMVSLGHLQQDCEEFAIFREEFEQKVATLNKEAMDCISQCVEQQIGADLFEKARRGLERTRDVYLKKKKKCDTKAAELRGQFETEQKAKNEISATIQRLIYKVAALKEAIQSDKDNKAKYEKDLIAIDKGGLAN